MKNIILIGLLMSVSTAAFANKYVVLDRDGNVSGITSVYGKQAKVDPAKNQYSDLQWEAFGITEEVPYIIKDGDVWRAMTQAEKDVIDAGIQQKALDEASEDVDMDALFDAIAKAVKNNLSTKDEVKAAFKASVDPKKVKTKK